MRNPGRFPRHASSSSRRPPRARASIVFAIGLMAGCADAVEESDDLDDVSDRAAPAPMSPMCEEPKTPDEVPWEVLVRPPSPPAPMAPGAWTSNGQLHLDLPASREVVTVSEWLVDPDEDPPKDVTHAVSGYKVTVVAKGVPVPVAAPGQTVIVAAHEDLRGYKLVTDVSVLPDEGKLWFKDVRVEDPEGKAVGHADQTGFVSEPLTCGEHALVRFGEIPAGMPSFHWPINENCLGTKCLQVRTAYVEAVHATWRMTQMLDPLADEHPETRSWAWDQPAVNAAGESAGESTSLRHYFGSYRTDRWLTIRELYRDHLNVLRSGEMDTIALRLKCPSESAHPGNACFTGDSWAHHSVKGWINICPVLWSDLDAAYANNEQKWLRWFNHTVAHEFFHHQWVDIDGVGLRALQDVVSHKHGNSCTNISTEKMISEPSLTPTDQRIQHLAAWTNGDGDSCGHRRVVLRTLDAYNTAARVIGEKIRSGQMVDWPLVELTPQPPLCVGGENCLCETVDPALDTPDGDAGAQYYCSDNGQDLQCMARIFDADDPVGICTDCDELRGPGCECRDGIADCDVGSCFGDDTNGTNMAWGRCYVEPPSFGCLVDCTALAGNSSTCMWDHPDWARCVTSGVGLPAASNCWIDGGHVDFNGDCVQIPECGPGAPDMPPGQTSLSCQDLGYPPYFICDDSFRCVPDFS